MEDFLAKLLQIALTIIGTLVTFVIWNNKQQKKENSSAATVLKPSYTNGYAKQASIDTLQKSIDGLKAGGDVVDRIVSDLNKDMETVIHELSEIKTLEIEELRVIKEVKARLDLIGLGFENDITAIKDKMSDMASTLKDIDKQTRG